MSNSNEICMVTSFAKSDEASMLKIVVENKSNGLVLKSDSCCS